MFFRLPTKEEFWGAIKKHDKDKWGKIPAWWMILMTQAALGGLFFWLAMLGALKSSPPMGEVAFLSAIIMADEAVLGVFLLHLLFKYF